MNEHRIWLGWYENGVAKCAYCGQSIEPFGVTRGHVVKGWRHA